MALSVYQFFVRNDAGDIVPGATITVRDQLTLATSTIYSDKAGTPLVNPFATDAEGRATFYAEPGLYNVEASHGLDTSTFADVEISVANDALNDDQSTENIEAVFIELRSAIDLTQSTMTVADWEANAEKARRDAAGSGALEWGNYYNNANWETVNEGLTYGKQGPADSNRVFWGWHSGDNPGGDSRVLYPVLNINGSEIFASTVNDTLTRCTLNFPPAPDGLDKADGTGRFTDLAAAITAGGNELSASVLNRQDFAFLEAWDELISTKDIVVPLGCVQSALTAYNGVTLVALNTLGVGQGYSAFGPWDTTTQGNGAQWSTLTDAQKKEFLERPENNIRIDENGEYIQRRYRIKTIPGLEGDWSNGTDGASATSRYLRHGFNFYVAPQGLLDTPTSGNVTYPVFANNGYSNDGADKLLSTVDTGLFCAVNDGAGAPTTFGHNGQCFAIPIVLQSRLNQGAYHPEFNDLGAKSFNTTGTGANGNAWHITSLKATNVSDCFNQVDATADTTTAGAAQATGAIGGFSGRTDGQFYDAIYAAYCDDQRMSALVRPVKEIHDEYQAKAQAGTVRGWEGLPFASVYGAGVSIYDNSSTVYILALSSLSGDTSRWTVGTWYEGSGWVINNTTGITARVKRVQVRAGGLLWAETGSPGTTGDICDLVVGDMRPHRAAEHTWRDIIAAPSVLATAFPSGIYGEWIPVIPTGAAVNFPINRKAAESTPIININRSEDNGATWTFDTGALGLFDTNLNAFVSWGPAATSIRLVNYKTPAHFTEGAANGRVLHFGDVIATTASYPNYGNILMSSLIGKLGNNIATRISMTVSLNDYTLSPNDGGFLATAGYEPSHETVSVNPSNGTSSVKTLSYLTPTSGVLHLNFAYKEQIYDATWGDNNKFEIVDNQSSLTDTNGNTVLYGTATARTPYFYADWEQS